MPRLPFAFALTLALAAAGRAQDLPPPVMALAQAAQQLASKSTPDLRSAVAKAREALAQAPAGVGHATVANLLGQILVRAKEPEQAAEVLAASRAQLGAVAPATLAHHFQLAVGEADARAEAADHAGALAVLAGLERLLEANPGERVKVLYKAWKLLRVAEPAKAPAMAQRIEALGGALWAQRLADDRLRGLPALGQALPGGRRILLRLDGTPQSEPYFWVNRDVGGGVVYNDGNGRGLLGPHLLPVTGAIYQTLNPVTGHPGRWLAVRQSKLEPDGPERRLHIDALGRAVDPPATASAPATGPLHEDAGAVKVEKTEDGEQLVAADGSVLLGGAGYRISGGQEGVVLVRVFVRKGDVMSRTVRGHGKWRKVDEVRGADVYKFGAYDLRAKAWLVPLDPGLSLLRSFEGGLAVAAKEGRHGVLGRDGAWKIEPTYESLTRQEDGLGWLVSTRVPKDLSNGVEAQMFMTDEDRARPDRLRYRFLDLAGAPRHEGAWAFATSYDHGFAEVRVAPEHLAPRSFGRYGLPAMVWLDARARPITPPGRVRLLDAPVSLYLPEEWQTTRYTPGVLQTQLPALQKLGPLYPYEARFQVQAVRRPPGDTDAVATQRFLNHLEKQRTDPQVFERLPDSKVGGHPAVSAFLHHPGTSQRTTAHLVLHPEWLVEMSLVGFTGPIPVGPDGSPRAPLVKRAQELLEDLRFRGAADF